MGKTKRSGDICCVPFCCVDGDLSQIKFYSFPKRSYLLEKRAKWIKALKKVNADGSPWEPSSRSRICSQHFVGGVKSEHPHSPAFLPTIFPEKYYGKRKSTPTAQLMAQNRFVRAMRRHQNLNRPEKKKQFSNVKTQSDELNEHIEQDINDVIIQPQEPIFCEAATLIDFYEENRDSTHINMFSMVHDNGLTCEAGTQANISIKNCEKRIITSKIPVEVGCGPTIKYEDKKVGPNPLDENDSLFVCQQGFRGLLSVKDEQNLIDLAGVSFSRFQLLLKAAGNCYNSSTSKDDILLIFLMRMKLGLTYSSIGVLFGIHRTTESRIFHISFAKVLVAFSPGGEIIFVSKCFGGRTTDAQITNQSGFFNFIEHGDLIMADKGFPEIKSALDLSGKKVIVVMPPFLHNGNFTADEVRETKKIASLRIHIERIMQRIKTYRITAKFPVSEFRYLDNIIFMTWVLVNLQPPIIKSSNNDEHL